MSEDAAEWIRLQLQAIEDQRALIARGLAAHNAEMDLMSMTEAERAAWRERLHLPPDDAPPE